LPSLRPRPRNSMAFLALSTATTAREITRAVLESSRAEQTAEQSRGTDEFTSRD
jgi:hypothetical protein